MHNRAHNSIPKRRNAVRQAILVIVVLTLAMSGCASQEMSVIKGAADAVGDEAGIKAVNTLVIEGT
jgi:uncharacterized protein YceK